MRKTIGLLVSLMLAFSVLASAGVVGIASAEKPDKPITPAEIKEVTFIHYDKAGADKKPKPPKPDNPGRPDPEPEPSYILLGLKLNGTQTYRINPTGSNIDADAVKAEIKDAFEAWDNVTSVELFDDNPVIVMNAPRDLVMDEENTVFWGKIVPPNAIAVTRIWYIPDTDEDGFGEIIEFDIAFNTFKKEWGIDPDDEGTDYTIDAFDVENIETHEVGHVVGLDDLSSDENSEATMYGYGSIGETKKITLEEGDIAGARAIYG